MKQLKYLIVSVLLLLSVIATNSFAGSSEVVFTDITQVTTALQRNAVIEEKVINLTDQVNTLEMTAKNCEDNITILEKQNKLLEERIKLLETYSNQQDIVIGNFTKLIKNQQEMYDIAIKESKPSFLEKTRDSVGFVGIGIAIGIIITLL